MIISALLGAWLGAVPIPLDWNRPWQVHSNVTPCVCMCVHVHVCKMSKISERMCVCERAGFNVCVVCVCE